MSKKGSSVKRNVFGMNFQKQVMVFDNDPNNLFDKICDLVWDNVEEKNSDVKMSNFVNALKSISLYPRLVLNIRNGPSYSSKAIFGVLDTFGGFTAFEDVSWYSGKDAEGKAINIGFKLNYDKFKYNIYILRNPNCVECYVFTAGFSKLRLDSRMVVGEKAVVLEDFWMTYDGYTSANYSIKVKSLVDGEISDTYIDCLFKIEKSSYLNESVSAAKTLANSYIDSMSYEEFTKTIFSSIFKFSGYTIFGSDNNPAVIVPDLKRFEIAKREGSQTVFSICLEKDERPNVKIWHNDAKELDIDLKLSSDLKICEEWTCNNESEGLVINYYHDREKGNVYKVSIAERTYFFSDEKKIQFDIDAELAYINSIIRSKLTDDIKKFISDIKKVTK